MRKINDVIGPIFLSALFLMVFILQSCINNEDVYDYNKMLNQDITTIQNYLSVNGIDALIDSTCGVFYVVHETNNGYKIMRNAEMQVDYEAYVFSESDANSPLIFTVKNLEQY